MTKSSTLRFVILLVAIIGVGVLVNTWAYLGEARVDRKPLKDFPTQLGQWQKAKDSSIDEPTMKVLRASDYLLREFQRSDGQAANFYVGYYASQREGASYHSPLNCLPGSGWTLTNPDSVRISLPDGRTFAANKYVIQNGEYKSLMIYWYQGRGRTIASEYWGKVYTVIDSVRLRRSDGAMVRVTVPIGDSETAALDSAKDLSGRAAAALDEYVPN
ncbi:MAG TPA: EpsI family protein [Pyrinomonadaceae bacterium]|nr:EpsI family protein [Pyrinomonadaceae bacterium]